MNEECEEKLWSWVQWNFRIRDEERRVEIIAAARYLYGGIPKEDRNTDLLPDATMVACLVTACLHFSKEYLGVDLRFACKNLVIEPISVIMRFNMPINYLSPKGELKRENGDIWIVPAQSLDLDAALVTIPPNETDADLNLNRHVLDFATKMFRRGIPAQKPAPNSYITAHYLGLAENSQLQPKIRFIALCLAVMLSEKDYLSYWRTAGELLTQINIDLDHHNAAINYYAMVLSAPPPTEVV